MKAYLFPGQGSQHVGMGAGLFDAFPDLTSAADTILGYSIRELCLQDPHRQLAQTQYTQTALYVVNALTCRQRLKTAGERPDFVAGHSLGEYNALECAGVMPFDEGLRLVKRRGELMSTAPKGAMAAVIGVTADQVSDILAANGLTTIDVANYNAPTQTIISGLEADIRNAQPFFEQRQAMYIPLNVGGAFHSRYMQPVAAQFGAFLQSFSFAAPQIPVITNINGLPYQSGDIARNLSEQITHSVRWLDGMQFLLQQGVSEFIELGPGEVLTKLANSIKSQFKRSNGGHIGQPAGAPQSVIAPDPAPPFAPLGGNPKDSQKDPRQLVTKWNQSYPIGTRVRVQGYDQALTTKTEAVILFGHRAAVYMQGYNGYFALDDVQPIARNGDGL